MSIPSLFKRKWNARVIQQKDASAAYQSVTSRLLQYFAVAVVLLPMNLVVHAMPGSGFVSGLAHPALGFDHLLAMLSVGILSALIGGGAIWLLPVTFVSVMIIGGGVALSDIPVPGQETAIVLSVIILGFFIAFGKKLPIVLALAFVAFFAFFHGYAHGAELPENASAVLFVAGFGIGTAVIHISGVFMALFASRNEKTLLLLRFAGAFFSGIGFQMIMSLR